MKKSKAEAAETRKRIVEVATDAFRCNGIRATGVAEIMAAAGLTHGAFYRHFDSKDQLIAEACAAGVDVLVDSAEIAAEGGTEAFLDHLEQFLSADYHDDSLAGCPFVSMGSELARADADTRRAATTGFLELIEIVARREGSMDGGVSEDSALFTVTSMIGAVTMARIVNDPAVSGRILDVARARLTGQSCREQSAAKQAYTAVLPAPQKSS